ncbi:sodium/calcium exchanger protein [Sarocladium implicatum]|nr:sodium/calcium exchanger protein [Sarocladium implicatum]
MRTPKLRGARVDSRPFYTVVLLLTLFIAYSYLAQTTNRQLEGDDGPHLLRRRDKVECTDVHSAKDKCAFVKEFCVDDDAGLISYTQFYYCGFGKARPVALAFLVVWLGLLFTTIGIAASDFFSINLSTIATILGLSESLAGVTFLAFGNGSPDVFSTFAAMSSNSASMAIGELIGAASFITGVVAGSMALVREFRVDRKTYARDICFFIVAVAFTMVFLADGHLRFWECCVMIGYYVVYVITVVCWHWYTTSRKRRLRREGEARSHYYGAANLETDELAGEPYRDDPDDNDNNLVGSNSRRDNDAASAESGPRIEIESPHTIRIDTDDPDDEDDHERMVAAEVASSMRVLRPRGKRSSTITPIRPSLVGALEFRSALAQLQRESNHKLTKLPDRAYSDQRLDGSSRKRATSVLPHFTDYSSDTGGESSSAHNGRGRAWSSGDASERQATGPAIAISEQGGAPKDSLHFDQESTLTEAHPPFTIGGNLAPPPMDSTGHSLSGASTPTTTASAEEAPKLHLQIPSRRSSYSDRSSPASPFPMFTESPMPFTPRATTEQPDFSLPGPARRDSPFVDLQPTIEEPRYVAWWPHASLPPPHVLLATLFPTLQGWREKSYWDKLVSAISVPSIFLLVITLPVVDSETTATSSVLDTVVDASDGPPSPRIAPLIAVENGAIEPESEWGRYRRHTLSRNHSFQSYRDRSASPSPRMQPLNLEHNAVTQRSAAVSEESLQLPMAKATTEPSSFSDADEEQQTWNRWLVCVQLFTGPLFAVSILWANMSEDMENPGATLLRMVLYTLLGSLVALGLLLMFTSSLQRPKAHYILCFLGFVISIAWISTIAGEVVGVLKTFGVVFGISEALLGLTIFAAGNSVGDLIADITVARLGYPVMAL